MPKPFEPKSTDLKVVVTDKRWVQLKEVEPKRFIDVSVGFCRNHYDDDDQAQELIAKTNFAHRILLALATLEAIEEQARIFHTTETKTILNK